MNKKAEANAIVKESITIALLKMMEKEEFSKISITELVKTAGVCRASFYRNYTGKEDVIYKYMQFIIEQWRMEYNSCGRQDLIKSLLGHYYKHKDIYLLLYRSGMNYMIMNHLMYECGPKPEHDNQSAYSHARFACGLFGWINEWLKRGMQETPEEMARLYHLLSEDFFIRIEAKIK